MLFFRTILRCSLPSSNTTCQETNAENDLPTSNAEGRRQNVSKARGAFGLRAYSAALGSLYYSATQHTCLKPDKLHFSYLPFFPFFLRLCGLCGFALIQTRGSTEGKYNPG